MMPNDLSDLPVKRCYVLIPAENASTVTQDDSRHQGPTQIQSKVNSVDPFSTKNLGRKFFVHEYVGLVKPVKHTTNISNGKWTTCSSDDEDSLQAYQKPKNQNERYNIGTAKSNAAEVSNADKSARWRLSIPLDPGGVGKHASPTREPCKSVAKELPLKGVHMIAHDTFVTRCGSDKSLDVYLKDGKINIRRPDGIKKCLGTLPDFEEVDVVKQFVRKEACDHCNRDGLVVNVILKRDRSRGQHGDQDVLQHFSTRKK